MNYDATIRIQSSVNVNYFKGISKSIDYIKIPSRTNELANELKRAVMPLCHLKLIETQSVSKYLLNLPIMPQINLNEKLIQSFTNMTSNLSAILASYNNNLFRQMALHMIESFKRFGDLSEKCLFLKIADEMGFPLYLEVDSKLQDRLMASYIENGNQCNKKEMREIILDYYDDDYIDHILDGIRNVQIFNSERVVLIEEGVETYRLGKYGSSASLFAVQLSGMIRDVYEELSTFYRLSNKEKQELLISYNQNCTPDSEKGMLLQIVNSQSQGFMIWYKVLRHFLNIVYSPKGHDMVLQPQRHMICHGKQTNYNTKEMNLKLILCMDIIAELAWRVKNMKKEYSESSFNI